MVEVAGEGRRIHWSYVEAGLVRTMLGGIEVRGCNQVGAVGRGKFVCMFCGTSPIGRQQCALLLYRAGARCSVTWARREVNVASSVRVVTPVS
jgi:hypothetical protein